MKGLIRGIKILWPYLASVIFWAVIILLTSAICCSCRSVRYVPTTHVKYDSIYVTLHERDSIYMQDSIYVRDKGDTVIIEKFRYVYKDKLKHDTLYIQKKDSIQVPYPVERELSRWEQIKIEFGGIFIGVLGVILLIGIFYILHTRK